MSHANPTSADFPKAPRSVWLGKELISASDIGESEMYEIFSKRGELSRMQVKQIMAAYDVSKMAHGYKKVQVRRSGDRYSDHPKAVALIDFLEMGQRNSAVLQAELLHDVLEDTVLKPNTIEILCGRETLRIVQMLTNPTNAETSERHYARKIAHYQIIRNDEEASQAKVSDRVHNLRTLEIQVKTPGEITEQDCIIAEKQFKESVEQILPMAKNISVRSRPYRQVLEKELLAVHSLLKACHYL